MILTRGVSLKREAQIDQASVDHAGEGRFCQAWRNALGNGRDRRARRHISERTIWQRDTNLAHGERRGELLMVGTGGLEPPTSCVSSRRSNL